MIVLKQMIVFFLIMMIGFYLAKKDILDDKTCKKISWIVVNVCGPIMVLNSALGDERVPAHMMVTVYIAALLIYLAMLVLGILMPYLLREKEKKVFSIMTIFGNVGFMGYPLVLEMYGQMAMLYAVVFNIFYNLFMYSYGITVMSGEGFHLRSLKRMCNVGMIVSVLTMVLYAFPIPLPDFFLQTLDSVSGMTAPLSMMVIGASFVGMKVKELFMDTRLIVFTVIRYLIFPIVLFPIMKHFILDETLLGVCLMMVTVPVGSMNVMIAQQYGGDVVTSSKGIALTTVLSVVLMPMMFMILIGWR